MVEQLGDEIDFRIITADRDSGDPGPYPNVTIDGWNQVGKAQVYYASPSGRSLRNLGRLIRNTNHDLLYLNSFFDPVFTTRPLLLRKLHLIPQKPVILAPRGEFSPGALAIKAPKKRFFLKASKALGLHKGILWQASSEVEQKHTEQLFPYPPNKDKTDHIHIALNLTPKHDLALNEDLRTPKKPGTLRLAFLSRITPMKNLDYALTVLQKVQGNVVFDIYGPVDRDKGYWELCKSLIPKVPANVAIEYKGPVSPDQVRDTFAQYHAFLLPTRGENFGHVIMESLSAGCPVILSDQTPWKNLDEKQSGWNIPLSEPEKFQSTIEKLVAMDETTQRTHAEHALQHAMEVANDQTAMKQNIELFQKAMRLSAL